MDKSLQNYYLSQLGIELWNRRVDTQLFSLERRVAACMSCELYHHRTAPVCSSGNPDAQVMMIGLAPYVTENNKVHPFTNKGGYLFDQMLSSIGFAKQNIYMTTLLKCCPRDDNSSHDSEMMACSDYLKQQIKLVNPQLIIVMGETLGRFLLGIHPPTVLKREHWHEYEGKAVLMTYHPEHLLCNPADKKKAYRDLLAIKQFIAQAE